MVGFAGRLMLRGNVMAYPRGMFQILAVVVLGACAVPVEGPFSLKEPLQRCGLSVAMDFRSSRMTRDNPPACELPTAKRIALTCAIHDQVRSEDYVSPELDEFGDPVGAAQPIPEYKVTGVKCTFTTQSRSAARCKFGLETPGSDGEKVPADVIFTHKFYQDHGPAHHIYSTEWWPKASCVPTVKVRRSS